MGKMAKTDGMNKKGSPLKTMKGSKGTTIATATNVAQLGGKGKKV